MKVDPAVLSRDVAHLHGEIRQLRNQQFLMMLAAITFFGVFAGQILAGDRAGEVYAAGYRCNALTFLSLVVMGILFFLTRRLLNMIIVLGTYLRVSGASRWESDYAVYSGRARKEVRPYVSQTGMHALVFMALGISLVLVDLLVVNQSAFNGNNWTVFVALMLFLALYILFVWGFAFRNWFLDVDTIEARWKAILDLEGETT